MYYNPEIGNIFKEKITCENWYCNHYVYGVYSPYLSATTAPSMSKGPDYGIQE